jgi:hypothetical protein
MDSKHPGFKRASAGIAQREGYSKERANRILAGRTRKLKRTAAGRKNPRLKRVLG